MKKLSIIIPHYNSVDTLKQLLSSIPLSNDIETIVVDDNSDKQLEQLNELVSSYSFKHVVFLKNNTSKKGAGICRNIGINNSNGEWIIFADSDDYFLDNFINLVQCYFNTNNDVVFFYPISFDRITGEKSNRHNKYVEILNNYKYVGDIKSELLLRYSFHVPWSKLIRKSFLIQNQIFFDEVIASNDVMFSAKVGYYMQEFNISNETIYCVTKNKGSLTVNKSEEVFDARLMVRINQCKFLESKLSKENIKTLNLRGTGFIVTAIKNRLGVKKVIKTIYILKTSGVKVFDLKYLNPVYLLQRIIYHYKDYKKYKRYYS